MSASIFPNAEPEPIWNPYYRIYARSRGMCPSEALAHDEKMFPGGKMAGFTVFISRRWDEFEDLLGYRPADGSGIDRGTWRCCYQAEFATWLDATTKYPGDAP